MSITNVVIEFWIGCYGCGHLVQVLHLKNACFWHSGGCTRPGTRPCVLAVYSAAPGAMLNTAMYPGRVHIHGRVSIHGHGRVGYCAPFSESPKRSHFVLETC